ncbi:hypothetical protein [Flavivirga sp. 57AJ16]|uniref:hypothetical protein n=1 Tax=Flavivirga sp. 57AJ16 TaxID=3025307 RepID=UPI0023652FBF|nr:hypothetical protein [Flavivirga sp. 57AJ16]MDD7885753.1 hypothetical protein [Flavivirga sp. 57AJ16]
MIKELKNISNEGLFYPDGVIIEQQYFKPNSDIHLYRYINSPLDVNKELNIVFVLPVKQGQTYNFGDPLTNLKDSSFYTKEVKDNVIFIHPIFKNIPWYANHPTDITIQQQTDSKNFVTFIKNKYSNFLSLNVSMIGFSKSGWGALSLLMHQPTIADHVFIWDAPLGIDELTFGYEMVPVFVNDAHFDTYDLNTRLPSEAVNLENKGIYIGGYHEFEVFSELITDEFVNYPNIDYVLDDTLSFGHAWNIEWMESLFREVDFILKS